MIKVKAKRTIFTVSVDGDIKQFTYDSQRNPSQRDLLSHARYITGSDDGPHSTQGGTSFYYYIKHLLYLSITNIIVKQVHCLRL